MRLTIEQARLLHSLQAVERAVNERTTLPILANILCETKAQELLLTATDLDVGVRHRVPLTDAGEDGAVALPARKLSTIVRECPQEAIHLEVRKNHAATLSCGRSFFRLQGLPPEDFPLLPPLQDRPGTQLPQATLKTLIHQTAFAMSLEETRFVLNGALVTIAESAITVVATDGRRLALATAKIQANPTASTPGAGSRLRMVVPAKAMRELARLLDPEDDAPVRLGPLQDNQLSFQFGDTTVITRLIDGEFPQYEGVIPKPSKAVLTCDRESLMGAIRRVSLMTTAASQAVVFELAPDHLTISKESPEVGSAREELPGRYTGQPMKLAFNPEFWLDALKTLELEEVGIELTSPDKPGVIRLPDFLYLVLPMKLA